MAVGGASGGLDMMGQQWGIWPISRTLLKSKQGADLRLEDASLVRESGRVVFSISQDVEKEGCCFMDRGGRGGKRLWVICVPCGL